MEKVLIILENPLVVAIITTGVNVLFNYLDKWILNYNIKKDEKVLIFKAISCRIVCGMYR